MSNIDLIVHIFRCVGLSNCRHVDVSACRPIRVPTFYFVGHYEQHRPNCSYI